MKVIIYIICWILYVYFSKYIPKKYQTYDSIISSAFLIYAAYWAFFVFPNTLFEKKLLKNVVVLSQKDLHLKTM